jgi:hypothetical protein
MVKPLPFGISTPWSVEATEFCIRKTYIQDPVDARIANSSRAGGFAIPQSGRSTTPSQPVRRKIR